jgi:hypothetical protein
MDDGSQGGPTLDGGGYPGFADGSGLRAAPASRDERAEAQKDDPIYVALDADVWVHRTGTEIGDDPAQFVIYETFGDGSGLYRRAFTFDDDTVLWVSEPLAVTVRTEFVPVVSESVVAERVSVRSSNALRLALEARKRRR